MNRTFNDGAANTPKPDFSPEVMERLFYWTRDYVSNLLAHTGTSEAFSLGEIGASPVLGALSVSRSAADFGLVWAICMRSGAGNSAGVSRRFSDDSRPRFPLFQAKRSMNLNLKFGFLVQCMKLKNGRLSA